MKKKWKLTINWHGEIHEVYTVCVDCEQKILRQVASQLHKRGIPYTPAYIYVKLARGTCLYHKVEVKETV